MQTKLTQILDFLTKAEKLKRELRHSWLSNNRQESVAEHTWRMALMAIVLKDELEKEIDLEKVLKMIIIHDIVEIEAGDVAAPDVLRNPALKPMKEAEELKAIKKLKTELAGGLGEEIYDLWMEFEAKESYEAKFANALDKLEVQLQHNHAPLETWEDIEFDMLYMMDKYVDFDQNMIAFKDMIVQQAEEIIKKEKPDKIKNR